MSLEQRAGADAAIDAWNVFADEHGLDQCTIRTGRRLSLVAERLSDIGGLENFKLALSQIPADDFLMGRVVPRDGGDRFRLHIDRLLSTGSGMGDLLARLIDNAASKPSAENHHPEKSGKPPPPPYWWRSPEAAKAARNAPAEGWEQFVKERANGIWPVEYLGPLPGSPDCLVPEPVIKKLNLIERYGASV
ncbi:hypothetical protein [Candidatus Filomicrobium marinum]|uniref:hypothetical protein n=1 Tax=Candidatus Filomicrobium marinum TaxID=1608628 RepID=UPI00126032DD|nr:hypothetical protein [Candidatus Filomicrobium marinum]